MKAGPLREYLRLMQPVRKSNDYGSEPTEYVETKRVHAERVKFSGRRSDEVGEHFAAYDAQFRIRDAHAVDDGWRVRHEGGHLYDVLAVDHNREKGMKTLICERVNE